MILWDDPRASFTGEGGGRKEKKNKRRGVQHRVGGWIKGSWERERRKILKLRN